MTIRAYCDAAYAIILDEYQRPMIVGGHTVPGMTLEGALARLADWATGVTKTSHEREEDLIAQQNAQALESLGFRVA